jgi:hypothetical protein
MTRLKLSLEFNGPEKKVEISNLKEAGKFFKEIHKKNRVSKFYGF